MYYLFTLLIYYVIIKAIYIYTKVNSTDHTHHHETQQH